MVAGGRPQRASARVSSAALSRSCRLGAALVALTIGLAHAGCLLPDYGSAAGGAGGAGTGGDGAGGQASPLCEEPAEPRVWRFGSQDASETVAAVLPLADGLLVAGEFEGEVHYLADQTLSSTGGADGFVMRLDQAGDAAWLTALRTTGDLSIRAARALPGGALVVAGEFSGALTTPAGDVPSAGGLDGFVARLSSDGELTHARLVGSMVDDRMAGIDVASDGSLVLAVGFTGPALIFNEFYPEASPNFAYARLSADTLEVLDQRGFEAAGDAETPLGIVALPDGRVAISGEYDGGTDFQVPNEPPAAQSVDGFLLVVALDGSPEWALGFGGGASALSAQRVVRAEGDGLLVGGVAHDPGGTARFGSIVVAEPQNGASYLWVARVDDADSVAWVETFPGQAAGETDLTRAVTAIAAGGESVYAALSFSGSGVVVAGEPLLVSAQASALVTLDATSGDALRYLPVGDALADAELRDLSESSCGVMLGGWFDGELLLPGIGPLVDSDRDLLIARLHPDDL